MNSARAPQVRALDLFGLKRTTSLIDSVSKLNCHESESIDGAQVVEDRPTECR